MIFYIENDSIRRDSRALKIYNIKTFLTLNEINNCAYGKILIFYRNCCKLLYISTITVVIKYISL